MKSNQLVTVLFIAVLALSTSACLTQPIDSGGNNLAASQDNSKGNRFIELGKNYNSSALTADGRRVNLTNGTWEWANNNASAGRSLVATMPNGRQVYLHPDGTWEYGGFVRNTSGPSRPPKPKVTPTPTPAPTPVPPSFLHIYQEDGGYGRATVYLDGEPIAYLRERRYFVIRVSPGQHILNIAKKDQGTIRLNLAPGRHYFVKNSEGFEGWGERLKLMGVSEAETEIGKYKLISGSDILRYDIMVEPRMSN